MKYIHEDRIQNEVDFIDAPKYNNSLKTLMEEYPDGVPDKVICKVLHISPETLDGIYKRALKKLKTAMGE